MGLYIYRFRVVNFTKQGLTALLLLKLHNWYGCEVALNEIMQSFESPSLLDQSQGHDEALRF